ncbi:MAG: cyclic nucleotide-binding domain-containing protein [Acidimicrobiia bacterium]
MASNEERFELLQRVPLLSNLTQRSLRGVANLAKEVNHAVEHAIVREGAGVHALHAIIEGTAVVTIGGREIKSLGPGDYFGEIAIFDSGPRTATVTATTPMTVLAIDKQDFLHLVASDSDLATRLLGHLAGIIREFDARSAD